ncbi:FtsX-like permease family protein [Candidatus Rariloculus sp.]|uniref:FtsX-like permease family protein n=1 Tax=Candidatus Rariloculus sp. TaxID=3101265 RepID=UPI003D14ED76
MSRLLLRSASRFYLRHPWQLALAIAGISLGVAVYVGVDLANDSARRAFELSTELVRGQTTHRLLPVGGSLPEEHYSELLREGRATRAAPIVETLVRIGADRGPRRSLLGVDPIKEAAFRDYSGFVPGGDADFTRLVTEPGTIMVPESLAVELSLEAGSIVDVWIDGRLAPVEVVGTLLSASASAETDPPIVTDISTAQELVDGVGLLSRIDLALSPEQARRLGDNPPSGTTLVAAAGQTTALTEMTRAFRTNLTALGLLALVVGMFLIYSTMSFSIVQRRPVIGVLRAIGVDQRQLLGSVLFEALAIGAVGGAIGLILGDVLARTLVEMVLRTIGDLYFSNAVSAATPSNWIYAKGAALGLGATLVGALGPAIDASRCTPESAMRRAALERTTKSRAKFGAILAVPTLVLAASFLLIESRSLLAALAGLFFVLCAGAMLTPFATMLLMKPIEPIAARGFGLPGLMAVRGVGASLSRTGVATAALAVAVATVIGVGLMISSFRTSLVSWLDTTLTADIYLSLDRPRDSQPFAPDLLAALSELPEVGSVTLTRYFRVQTALGDVGVRATEPGPRGWGVDIVGADAEIATAALADSEAILVTEPVSYRFGLSVGDAVRLPTATGEHMFTIAGVFRDYSTGNNAFLVSLETYRRHWLDDSVTGVGVHVAPGYEVAAAAGAIRAALGGSTEARLRTTEAIEEISLAVFDRTFQITEVLRWLAGLIAFLGILSAVLAIELERVREIAILRALGFLPGELATQILTRTGLLGVAAGLCAVPLGVALAGLLVHVINRRSFGWSMDLIVTPAPVLLGVALAIVAALLAGIYPAFHGSRTGLDRALRDE